MIEAIIVMKHKDGRFGWVSTETVTTEQMADLDHHLGLGGFVCTLQSDENFLYFDRDAGSYNRVACKFVKRYADGAMMMVGHNREVFEIDKETNIIKTKKGYYVVK